MAVTKKQLANLKPIKKGEVKNPLGGRAHNPDVRRVKNLTQAELVEVMSFIIKADLPGLAAIKDNPKASVLQIWVAAVAITAIKKGDMHALDALLNRTIGKVKENVQISTAEGPAKVILRTFANGREAPVIETNSVDTLARIEKKSDD